MAGETPRSGGCCCLRSTKKVAPVPDYSDYDIVEVRPGRHLCILHINQRKRDEGFEKEMEQYTKLQMRTGKYGCQSKSGKLPGVSIGGKRSTIPSSKITSDTMSYQQMSNACSSPHQNLQGAVAASKDGTWQRCGSRLSDTSYRTTDSSPMVNHAFQNLHLNLPQDLRSENTDVDTSAVHPRNTDTVKEKTQSPSKTEDLSMENLSPTTISGGYCHASPDETSSVRIRTATSVNLDVRNNTKDPGGDCNQSTYTQNVMKNEELASDQIKKNNVIFFIHGVGGSSAVWQAQIDHFKREGYELVVPDLIGHGYSCAPHNPNAYTFEEIVLDLLVIFDLYCKRSNTVIAHSYGASFAALLGRRRVRKINHLVLISGGSPTPLAPQPGTFSAPTWFLSCCKPMVKRGFRKSAFLKKKSHAMMEKAFDVPTYVLKHIMNGQNWLEGGEDYHRWLETAVLLIYGRQDRLVTLEEEQEMEKVIFGSILEVVEGASHMVMMEQPEMVNNLIHRFLINKLQRPTSPVPTSPVMDKSVMGSRASVRSNKAVPSGIMAANLR